MLIKYARSETPLEIKTASEKIVPSFPGEAFSKFAALEDSKTEDGFLYVRTRAISSRVNKNNDGWPAEELAKAYKTFIGRPVFVDHNNSDPKRTRGVIIDSKLHVEDDKTSALDPYYATAPDHHKPPTWVEILIEVDAKTYPKLAKAIKNGHIDATSMGANIDKSICSVCSNEASVPSDYCDHIKKKGATFEITADNGERVKKKSWEDCYGVNFFEDSFVFDPADETALNLGVDTKPMTLAKVAAEKEASWFSCQECHTLVDEDESVHGHCPKCGSTELREYEGAKNMPRQPGKRGTYEDLKCPNCSNDTLIQKQAGYLCPTCNSEFDENLNPTKLNHGKGDFAEYPPHLSSLIKVAEGYHVSCRDCGHHLINVQDDANNYYYCPGCDRTESNLSTLAPFLEHKTSEFGMGGQGVDSERVINHEPQSDMTKAPQKVDTLKDDIECPNCHSDYLNTDPDGILRCPTCSYEQPPEGLDNPDLGAAQRENEKDLPGAGAPVVRAEEEDADLKPNADSADTRNDNFIAPIKPLQAATKKNVTTEEISEMIWKRKIHTDSATKVDKVLDKLAGRKEAGSVETPITYQGGIHFGTHAAFQKHGLNATVHYPGAPAPLPIPGNAMQHFMMQMNAQKAQGLGHPGELVVRLDAPDDQLDQALNLIHNGGADHVAAVQPKPQKEVVNPQPDKKEEKIESDQLAPITSDRRVIKREETPDGHRSEQIIEETSQLGLEDEDEPKDEKKDKKDSDKEENSEEPKSEEDSEEQDDKTPDFLKKKEPVAAAVVDQPIEAATEVLEEKDSAVRVLAALAVAEEYVDAGLLPKESKLAFVGQLENSSDEVLATYRSALALFKSANTSRRVAHTNRTLPRLATLNRPVASVNGVKEIDDVPLEAIFL